MALVDYASDSDDNASAASTEHVRDDIPAPPKKKRQRTASPPRYPELAASGSRSTLATNNSSSSSSSSSSSNSSSTATTTAITTTATSTSTAAKAPSTPTQLPPLPPAFHDLYAATVRTAPRDDPALHQGRTRQIPHVPGLWPSHVYVEWWPPPPVHALLCDLIAALEKQQQLQQHPKGPGAPQPHPITGFLLSDVGVPQPLHVSLSRPLALSTEQKGQFLSELEAALAGVGGGGSRGHGRGGGEGGSKMSKRVTSFSLRCTRVEWHRTVESGRSFLVLRVRSSSSSSSSCSSSSGRGRSSSRNGATTTTTTTTTTSSNSRNGGGDADARRSSRDDNNNDDNDQEGSGQQEEEEEKKGNVNPELTELLRRCNEVAERHGQPPLYRWAEEEVGEAAGDEADRRIGEAFHVSIAWSFAEPTEDLIRATERVFDRPEVVDKIRQIEIPVEGVKVKIGNIITHVALEQRGKQAIRKSAKNLLGL